jgi:NAD(P)-dependent dehydrogenase (short-subunit alcohol dehydrogenase family)
MSITNLPSVAFRAARPNISRQVRCSSSSSGGHPTNPAGAARDYKVALVTGGNTGIGFITAQSLAEKGYYVVLGCRNKDKAEAARDRIKAAVPGNRGVEVATFDLADLSSVQAWATRARDFGLSLDLLVNNAGVMATPAMKTQDGFEYQLGVNHMGHFLLTNMLLPLMTSPERPSRIVNVSSAAHMFGHMNFDDLQSTENYDAWRSYGQSKLANVLFTYELNKRLPAGSNTTVNTLHPGVVNTELGRYLLPEKPAWWQMPVLNVLKAFTLTPEQGAATSIYLASSPEVEGVSGKYFDKCKPVVSSKESYDAEVATKLWNTSAELIEGALGGAVVADLMTV